MTPDLDLVANIAYLKEETDLTWEEIGEQTGTSGSQARGLYRRHRDKLDELIEPELPKEDEISVNGLGPNDDLIEPDLLWEAAFLAQEQVGKIVEKKKAQEIRLPVPCGLALFSDIHFGSGATDYKRVKQDAEIVVNTPRFFGEFHGDGCDNWLITKLARLQRGQVLTHDKEWQLFQAWLDLLGDRLKIVVSGNHDNWSISMGGTDRVRDLIRGLDLLYDPDEVEFDLVVGEESYRFLIRHKWKWSSIFNPTHGIEVSWQRNKPFDVGIGGHTHIATLHRPFIRHGKRRHAIITGTYKLWDRFGLEIGLPAPASYGSGALVFDKFGRMQWFDELELAANYLTYLLS